MGGAADSEAKSRFYLDQSLGDMDDEFQENKDEIIKFGTGEEYIKTMLQKLDTMKTDPKFIEFYNVLPSYAKVAITKKFISELETYSSIFSKEIARNYGIDEKLWINQLNEFLVNYKKLNTEETYNMLSTVESYNNYSTDTISSFLKKREKYSKPNSEKAPWKGGEGPGENILNFLTIMVKAGVCGAGLSLGGFLTASAIAACMSVLTPVVCLGLLSSAPPIGFLVLSPIFLGGYLCMELFKSEIARNEQKQIKKEQNVINNVYDNLNVFKVGDIVIVKGRNNFYRINNVKPIYIFDPFTVTRKAIFHNYELCEIIKQKDNGVLINVATTNNIITRGHGDLWLLLKIGDNVLYKEKDNDGNSRTAKGSILKVTVDENTVRSLRWRELKFFEWRSVKKITYSIKYDDDSQFKSNKAVENNSCWFWHRFSLKRPDENERYEFSIGETVHNRKKKCKIVKIIFDDLDKFGKKLTYVIEEVTGDWGDRVSTDSNPFTMKKWVENDSQDHENSLNNTNIEKPLSTTSQPETAIIPTNASPFDV